MREVTAGPNDLISKRFAGVEMLAERGDPGVQHPPVVLELDFCVRDRRAPG